MRNHNGFKNTQCVEVAIIETTVLSREFFTTIAGSKRVARNLYDNFFLRSNYVVFAGTICRFLFFIWSMIFFFFWAFTVVESDTTARQTKWKSKRKRNIVLLSQLA